MLSKTYLVLLATALAVAAADTKVHLAPLQKRHTQASSTSFNSLFARQDSECGFGYDACSDGISCCPSLETCCLDGCCQFLYTCDPTGLGTQSQPCVCTGLGCPDPDNDDDDSVSSTTSLGTTATISSVSSATSVRTSSSSSSSSSTDDDEGAVTSSSALLPPPQTSTTAMGTSVPAESSAGMAPTETGAAGGGDTGAGVQVSSLGVVGVVLLTAGIGFVGMGL